MSWRVSLSELLNKSSKTRRDKEQNQLILWNKSLKTASKTTEWSIKIMKIQIMVKMLLLHQVKRLRWRIHIKKLIIILGFSSRINLREEVKINYLSLVTRIQQVKKLRISAGLTKRSAVLLSTLTPKHNFLHHLNVWWIISTFIKCLCSMEISKRQSKSDLGKRSSMKITKILSDQAKEHLCLKTFILAIRIKFTFRITV